MKLEKLLVLFLFTLFTFYACNKEEIIVIINDPSSTYEQYGLPFQSVPATEDIIMYEVNLRAFSPEGNLQGVINRLDEIEALGVNVIWLMPIHPIGQVNSVNSPYSVKDYKTIGSEYGSLEDLRSLTDVAHERGIAVIMDWVANHTSWDNAWISNKSWYTQDNSGNIIHPAGTNWLDVADLNYDNTKMREAMIDALKYWIFEANIDGFRCDYADGVPFDFWKQAWISIGLIPDRKFILFAEGTRGDHFDAGFDLNFGWQFYGALKDAFNGQSTNKVSTAHNNEYSNLRTGKHWVRFTTNHDESAWDATPISLFKGNDGALAASVVTIFTGGVPLIYGSQEVGAVNNIPFFSNSSINWNTNSKMLSTYKTILQFYSASEVSRKGLNIFYKDDNVVNFKKTFNTEEMVVIVNVRNTTINYNVPIELKNTTWMDVMNQNTFTLEQQIVLKPFQFYILEK